MEIQIIPKQNVIPKFDSKSVAIKHIEYYPFGDTYEEKDITQEVIDQILNEIPKGISIYLFLDPNGEMNWLEVVSDGQWLSLGYCFEDIDSGEFTNYYSYNPDFADTIDLIDDANFSDENVYTNMESGGQSPIPKIQAIQDMKTGIKAVEYFIRTGKIYPGIDLVKD